MAKTSKPISSSNPVPLVNKKAKSKVEPLLQEVIEQKPLPPINPVYVPNENDTIARVYIEEKSVSAYRMPLVEKPPSRFADIKTYGKENWPVQKNTILPDYFTELDDKTKAYLRLPPYGDNLIINRKQITKLLNFFFDIKELPLPESLNKELKKQLDYVRSLVNLIGIDESEANSEWKKVLKDEWVPLYPFYKCQCVNKKRNPKSSPNAKAIKSKNSKKSIENIDDDK